ncbi:MAG: hypothetical protein PVF37_11470, partial [Desulfobacterales bacterium]
MMKITDIKAYVLEAKLPKDKQFVWAQARVTSRVATLVEIFTDDGIIGLGEAFGFSPLAIKAVIEGRFKEILIGENPFDINRLWDKLYTATRMEGQKGIAVQALSAVDIALWDIKGKFYDTPVSNLLGGCYRDR